MPGFDNNEDAVIPCKGTLEDRTPSLLPLPINSDPPPSFTSTRFDDGILPTSHFSTRLPSPSSLRARDLCPRAWVRLNRLLLHSFVTLDPWGASPFLFSSPLSPAFSIVSSLVLCSRVSSNCSFPGPSSHPCLRFLHHFTLFFFTFVKSHSFCAMSFLRFHYLSLCVFV